MTTSTKSNDTRAQLRSLMSQHTAATFSKPTSTPAATAPVRATRPQPVEESAFVSPSIVKYSVRMTAKESDSIDAMTLEVHQRLHKRITVSDVIRIGLSRMGKNVPINDDEIEALRALDRRRSKMIG